MTLLMALLLAQTAQPVPPPVPPATARSGGPIEPERDALRLVHVDLAVETLPKRRMLSARATLTVAARAPAPRILLDLDGVLRVSAVSIDGTALPRARWRQDDGRIVIDRALATGTRATVQITYAGPPRVAKRAPWDDGFVWSESNGKPWFGSTAQGAGCDLWWPCLDFPAGEPGGATLHLTVPAGLSAPTNGVLLGIDRLPDGRSTWHWRSGPVNPYTLAISVGPYREISGRYRSRYGNTIPLSLWHLEGKERQAARLFDEFAPTLDFFESVIGPYPFGDQKVGVVETPYLGMEHQTINAYGNDYRAAPEGFDWLFQHEFSHEWFGNQLTAADWDDFWLHEAFAAYMQPAYAKWREGDARYISMLLGQRVRIAAKVPMVSGTSRTSQAMASVETGGPGTDVYFKGAWMLHTLRHMIGDRAFLAATRRLVYGRPDPRPGNFRPRFGTTRDFTEAVKQESGRDLDWFFDVYLRQAALPDLIETRDADTLTLRWKVTGGGAFPLPIEIEIDGVVRTLPMIDGTSSIPVARDAHVVIDPMARVLRRSMAVERMQEPRVGPG
ncbi:M1 family metallopeptidase [Sphingomonas sp. CFBP 13720]|uniref:M1 family metallopeptidase n=1 Tax=Sphingomonas sp. CFBP 13720 TaxID=2775302 RepID=UPI001781B8DB|nr:M1 family metallopeptidase [Sphingomonas sp. CFBP 13720]MBD8676948.1 M1 family metallopeptidase [Sphingomonas sp. CFBP 13720]